ncbi:hypothetical protein QOZ80_4AG0301720 [Eleusine coracana subsp. coracana]|nr:hypothetical protein QOZ80_4AG0301720 [Eleusine coracana subsp. coracana]
MAIRAVFVFAVLLLSTSTLVHTAASRGLPSAVGTKSFLAEEGLKYPASAEEKLGEHKPLTGKNARIGSHEKWGLSAPNNFVWPPRLPPSCAARRC